MWAQLLAAAVGAWLTAAPAVLGFGGTAADNAHVAGPLAVTIGLIAASEVMRPVRWANLAVGAWLLASPLIIGAPATARVNAWAVGAALFALACVRGAVKGRYAGGWSSLWGGARDDRAG